MSLGKKKKSAESYSDVAVCLQHLCTSCIPGAWAARSTLPHSPAQAELSLGSSVRVAAHSTSDEMAAHTHWTSGTSTGCQLASGPGHTHSLQGRGWQAPLEKGLCPPGVLGSDSPCLRKPVTEQLLT